MRSRNKLIVIGVGSVVAISLASLGAVLDGIAPQGAVPGFLVRTVPVALAIPLLMLAFHYLCDKWSGTADWRSTSGPSGDSAGRAPGQGASNDGGMTVGCVTRIETQAREPCSADSPRPKPVPRPAPGLVAAKRPSSNHQALGGPVGARSVANRGTIPSNQRARPAAGPSLGLLVEASSRETLFASGHIRNRNQAINRRQTDFNPQKTLSRIEVRSARRFSRQFPALQLRSERSCGYFPFRSSWQPRSSRFH